MYNIDVCILCVTGKKKIKKKNKIHKSIDYMREKI